jgi:hypothetical protein
MVSPSWFSGAVVRRVALAALFTGYHDAHGILAGVPPRLRAAFA